MDQGAFSKPVLSCAAVGTWLQCVWVHVMNHESVPCIDCAALVTSLLHGSQKAALTKSIAWHHEQHQHHEQQQQQQAAAVKQLQQSEACLLQHQNKKQEPPSPPP
jgi:hypothetical protein